MSRFRWPARGRSRRRSSYRILLAAVLLARLALPGAAAAEAPAPILDPAAIRFDLDTRGQRWLLTVSGPGGFYARGEFDGGAPTLTLIGETGEAPADGAYIWELRRLDTDPAGARDAVRSGAFHVVNGRTLVPGKDASEGVPRDRAGTAGPATRAPTHSGDVTIEGRLCVGSDCTDAESFPFLVVKMKAQNNALGVEDTSALSGFPTGDWRIKFNDTSSGGTSYFAIQDSGDDGLGMTIPFRIDAGAPANSIRIDQNGRVGLGTATPSATLQVAGDAVVDGDLTAGSSREIKHAFAPVEPRAVLDRLLEVPISAWSYRGDPSTIRHMGPVAEEFSAAFGLGRDDRHLSPVDLSGVAFAAIQGLHQVVRQRDAEIAELRASRDELAARLAALEKLIAGREAAAP